MDHITWRPNPALGPADCHTDRLAYYRTECEVTQKNHEYLLDIAGLGQGYTTIQDTFMCLHGDDKLCRVIFEKKIRLLNEIKVKKSYLSV